MANRYWVGGSGNWSDDTNHWATSSGGSPGGGNKPGTADTAIFDASSGSGTCTVDETIDIAAFDHQTATSIVFDANSNNMTVSGDFAVADAASMADFSAMTVTIDGTGNLFNPRAVNAFNNLTFSGAITTTLTATFTVLGTWTTGTGTSTIQDDGSTRTVVFTGVSAAFTNNGPIWNPTGPGTLILNFDGAGTFTLTADDFGNVDINVTIDGTTVTLTGNVTCRKFMQTDDTDVNLGGNTLTVTSDWQIGGNVSSKDGSVFNVQTGNVTCGGDLLLRGADSLANTLNCGSGNTIQLAGNWDYDSADTVDPVFNDGTSTVLFNGTGAQSFDPGGQAFFDVDVNGTGNTVTLQDALGCRELQVLGGSFNDGGYACTLSGLVNVNTTGTLTATGDWTQTGDANFVFANNGTYSIGTMDLDLQGTGNLTLAKANLRPATLACAASGKTTTVVGGSTTSGFKTTLTVGPGMLTINSTMFGVLVATGTPLVIDGSATINGSSVLRLRANAAITVTLPALTMGGTVDFYLDRLTSGSLATFNMNGAISILGDIDIVSPSAGGRTIVFNTNNYTLACADFSFGASTSAAVCTVNLGSSTVICSSWCADAYNQTTTNLNMGSAQVSCSGAWIFQSNHTVDEGTSTVELDGAGAQAVTSNGKLFHDLTIDKAGGTATMQDALTCADFLLTLGGFATGSNTMDCDTFDQDAGTFNPGVGSVDINTGGMAVAIGSTFSAGSGPTITFKSTLAGPHDIDNNDIDIGNATLAGSGVTYRLASDFRCQSLTMTTAANVLNTSDGTDWDITCTVNLSIISAVLTANSSDIEVGGNWIFAAGTFNKGTSTVIFAGTIPQTVFSSGMQFHHITITNAHPSGVVFQDAMNSQGTFTWDNTGSPIKIVFDETGAHVWTTVVSGGGEGTITLRSEVDTNAWDVTLTNAATVTDVDVKDSNLSGANIDATHPSNTDSGNNSANWIFAAPPTGAMPMAMDTYRRRRI